MCLNNDVDEAFIIIKSDSCHVLLYKQILKKSICEYICKQAVDSMAYAYHVESNRYIYSGRCSIALTNNYNTIYLKHTEEAWFYLRQTSLSFFIPGLYSECIQMNPVPMPRDKNSPFLDAYFILCDIEGKPCFQMDQLPRVTKEQLAVWKEWSMSKQETEANSFYSMVYQWWKE